MENRAELYAGSYSSKSYPESKVSRGAEWVESETVPSKVPPLGSEGLESTLCSVVVGEHLSIVWRGLEWSQRLGKRLPGLHQLIIEKLIWITYKQMLISRQSNDAFLMNGTHQKARFCARSVWLGVELESTQFGILTVWFMMTCCLVAYNLDPIFKTNWMMLTSTSDFKISFQ